jgi:hypothetical protein
LWIQGATLSTISESPALEIIAESGSLELYARTICVLRVGEEFSCYLHTTYSRDMPGMHCHAAKYLS